MDKLDRILQNSARQATEALPVDAMWESLQKAAQVKRQKRKVFLRQASMAAMLVVSLGVGVALGRSPMFAPAYVVVNPPKTDATPAPPEETPDNTVIDPPGYTTIPDNIVVDPPKTDGNIEETVTFVMQRHFDNLPVTDSVKDLLPGWLPDILRDKIFTMDASSGYWKMQNQDNPDEWIGFNLYIAINGEDWVDGMLEQEMIGLPEGYSAGSMLVGSGFLLRYESASEGSEPTEYWMLRVSEDTYVQCYGSVSREDQMKIIENLGV